MHRRQPDDDPAVEVIDRIPATAIERTLLDLAAVLPRGRAGLALDDALRRGLTTLREMRETASSLKGRAGSGALRRLLEIRDERDAAAESPLENAMLRLVRKHGLPPPIPQFRVISDGVFVARLDFAYPSHQVGIETDGYRWHANPERWKRDLRRENRLKLLGWTLLRFSWEDVHKHPEQVAAHIRTALHLAGSLNKAPSR